LGQVEFTVEQTLKAGGAVAEMDADNAVVDLAATPEPLSGGADGMRAALRRSRFVNAADGFLMSMLAGDQPLTVVPHTRFIPLDRFHESL